MNLSAYKDGQLVHKFTGITKVEKLLCGDRRFNDQKYHFGLDPYPGCDGISQDFWDNRDLCMLGWDGKEYFAKAHKDDKERLATQREV